MKKSDPSSVSPTGMVLLSIVSTQLGSALAKRLFELSNPTAVVLLRVGFTAILLLLVWRPTLDTIRAARLRFKSLILFGLALALMNLSFYLAIERIPIGIAVTLEFIGPLGVAVANSRKFLDGVWVLLAAIGVALLAPVAGAAVDPAGIVLALVAGGFWAAYILLSAHIGRIFTGGVGLALAMTIGAIVLLPVGLVTGGATLLNPKLLLLGCGVALLSSAIPYSLELQALRFLPTRVFGVLLSLEPAAAALTGLVVLHESLDLRTISAIGLVTIAATGAATCSNRGSNRE